MNYRHVFIAVELKEIYRMYIFDVQFDIIFYSLVTISLQSSNTLRLETQLQVMYNNVMVPYFLRKD